MEIADRIGICWLLLLRIFSLRNKPAGLFLTNTNIALNGILRGHASTRAGQEDDAGMKFIQVQQRFPEDV